MTRAYAYCVGPAELPGEWGSNGIGGARVHAVRRGELAALVSPLPDGAGVPRPTREHLLAHDFVVWAATQERTVLPVAFGTVFRGEADVAAALDACHDAAVRALAALDERVEIGVRVLRGRDDGAPPATTVAGAVRDAVGRAAGAVVPMDPVGERTLLCVALLVAREEARGVADRVHAAVGALDPALRVRVTGPWAPYHFARLRLRVDLARHDPERGGVAAPGAA